MEYSEEMQELMELCEPGTVAFRFKIDVGFLHRGIVRKQIDNSVSKFVVEGIPASMSEDRRTLSSTFHFRAYNIPESYDESLDRWVEKIQSYA